jgi:hypothetical protein
MSPDPRKRRAPYPRRHTTPDLDPFPSIDDISDRAHMLWIADGRRPDGVVACWRRAEDDLLDRAAQRTVGRSAS